MTYLETVNKILKRLRERTVTSVEETPYSALIGIFVNDAKQVVEEAWKWSALRTTLTATTTSGIFSYELNGTQNNFDILDVVNDTDDFFLQYKEAHSFNGLFLNSEPATGSPYYYSFNGISSDGDTQVDLYPIPDDTYTLRFNIVQRQPDLETEADTIQVPAKPVELLAYAMAIEERGEDGGVNPVTAYAIAERALSDAITLDCGKHPEEIIWVAP